MADTNGGGAVQAAADPVAAGLQAVSDALSADQKKVAEADASLTEKQRAAEAGESGAKSASQQYSAAVANLRDAHRALKEKVLTAEQTERDANAENQAADVTARGGVITVGQALKMMEQEKRASKQRKDAESDLLKYTMQYGGEVLSSGAQVVAEQFKGALDGIGDSFGVKGVAALVGGAAVGAVANADSPLADIVTDTLTGYIDLKENVEIADGVEEKAIDGMEDEEAYARYMAGNAGGTPSDPYLEENGGNGAYDGPPKDFGVSGQAYAETSADPGDGLRISDEDLDLLTDPERLTAEAEAQAARTEQEAGSDGLLSSIAQSDIVQAAIGAVAKNTGLVPDAPEVPDVPDEEEFAGLELG